ncbi:leucine-rich repeat receptor protein kinase HPCA1-like isoform X1 [Alnus glutinosa]|uniref:leucine-rich repeat receptor protein kinase HPCA1-like isoform X1 n=1 Tax=Alnus glutinosa TaxID=3517 RepID=UPI002D778708|nr:leucine-rich repeat receptor protein kinase HPCA1-like isoform X1 [Alnus glutinosa]
MLLHAKHFHLDNNKLSGKIPPQLFSSNIMILLHLYCLCNCFSYFLSLMSNIRLNVLDMESKEWKCFIILNCIPETIGNVQTLEVIRFGRNAQSGTLPWNLSNLVNVNEMYLSNNKFAGPIPNLTGMSLAYV